MFALLALVAISANAEKPVFDGTFGANCPPCKEFGQTVLKKLYAADGESVMCYHLHYINPDEFSCPWNRTIRHC
jgi:hypothetical protein